MFEQISYVMEKYSTIVTPLLLLVIWFVFDKIVAKICSGLFRDTKKGSNGEDHKDEIARQAEMHRMNTIRDMVSRTARVLLALIMLFWILNALGIDLRPIIAGIGVIGLALSLAAQNIIKDVLNGFLILIEDQFNVGDFVELGSLSGTVEQFTMRATRLRNLQGQLLIIPNGTIDTVINYTKDYSVALVKIGITYEADYDKARKIAGDLAAEMAKDPENIIMSEPSFHGITDFGDNAVEMRVLMKTAPGLQWGLERKYREKLKDLYDAEGIIFAYPQIVFHEGVPLK